MSQVEKILDYMNKFGSISTMEAFMDLGITRLAARIAEIEQKGVQIEHSSESSVNRFGQKVHYVRYSKAA